MTAEPEKLEVDLTEEQPAEELWPRLAEIREDDGPITGKLPPEVIDTIRTDVSKSTAKAQKLLDFIGGRDFRADNRGWELNTRAVALDLGIPGAVIDVAIRRLWDKFKTKFQQNG